MMRWTTIAVTCLAVCAVASVSFASECRKCEGTGLVICNRCNGEGSLLKPSGIVVCEKCNGRKINMSGKTLRGAKGYGERYRVSTQGGYTTKTRYMLAVVTCHLCRGKGYRGKKPDPNKISRAEQKKFLRAFGEALATNRESNAPPNATPIAGNAPAAEEEPNDNLTVWYVAGGVGACLLILIALPMLRSRARKKEFRKQQAYDADDSWKDAVQ